MQSKKLEWFWLGPAFAAVGHGVRWAAFGEPFGHGGRYLAEARAMEAGITPLVWTMFGLALVVLLIAGRKREAVNAWIATLAIIVLGWWLIGPVFYA